MAFPRIIIAALRGGSGKTLLSIGITAALSASGKSIAPFKKGPDYIDAGWLTLAAGRPCYNLDSFLLSENQNLQSFLTHSHNCDIAVIEGNRGLYDGIDLEGSTSTAELAKLLKCPVVLCVDCTKITRTMAAVVAGCLQFDPQVAVRGVVLNRVANKRHEQKLRDSIEHYCRIPVLGAIPRLTEQLFPERHLGLVPTPEHDWARDSIDAVVKIAREHLDLDAMVKIAREATTLKADTDSQVPETSLTSEALRTEEVNQLAPRSPQGEAGKPRIGIIKDSAFQFYYPENIDALANEGADVVFISPLEDKQVPELDGLYIGGGFPETHGPQLADNTEFSARLKSLVEDGFPIYAECGGLMYLGENLILEGQSYPMTGILPLTFDFFKRPQGHGYTISQIERKNPYFEVGSEIRGHEFHYSRVSNWTGDKRDLVFHMKRGVGIAGDRDGILYKNVLATYTHLHAVGTPQWAKALVRQATLYKRG
jgi:cobyrinic acid a,c-diamide synthase